MYRIMKLSSRALKQYCNQSKTLSARFLYYLLFFYQNQQSNSDGRILCRWRIYMNYTYCFQDVSYSAISIIYFWYNSCNSVSSFYNFHILVKHDMKWKYSAECDRAHFEFYKVKLYIVKFSIWNDIEWNRILLNIFIQSTL